MKNDTPPTKAFNVSLIKPYIGNIVQIKVDRFVFNYEDDLANKASTGHTGTGFVYDAQEGVICTNFHVISNTFRGKVTVILDDGSRYDDDDVEILGTSPSSFFGDYAFLRVKKIANTKLPMQSVSKDFTHIKRGDPVAFMGHSSGSFSIETGIVNDPYDFWSADYHESCFQSFKVQMDHKGGASGSPVFNDKAKVIGVLFAGDDSHAKICPISYINRAYDELMSKGAISAITLGFPLNVIHVYDVARYFDVPLEIISPFVSKESDQGKKLLMVSPIREQIIQDNPLKRQDVILTIEEEAVGIDLLRLTSLLWKNDVVSLKILRGQQILDIKVHPRRVLSTFMESMKVKEGLTVYSANSLFSHVNDLLLDAPIYVSAVDKQYYPIMEIAITPIHTFRDLVEEFYKKVILEKKRHFLIVKQSTKHTKEFVEVDVPHFFSEFYINRFNTKLHKWENITLIDYVNELFCPHNLSDRKKNHEKTRKL